ncbi:MBL fold metallo-hydrolase [Methanomethylovorans sp.]|uniref:MBL fold metallo-hydrolase n=1 Tax=Methanomethylovorans sp. TaxID=2758717 RepID=UPI001BD5C9E1|nr:MBL fold metallo-hydrolase [Methanomethylovorans sp.]
MKITLLGTGDAPGTPVIGCTCPTCTDAHNGGRSKRTRSSILIETEKGKVLVDTGPDLRFQLLGSGVQYIDGVIWTHTHYDHFAGFAEFHRVQYNVDVYGIKETLDYILEYLHYMHPQRHEVRMYTPFLLIGLEFTLFEVVHPPAKRPAGVIIKEGQKKVVITGDTQRNISSRSLEVMIGPDILIADAIVPPNVGVKKHMNSKEALDLAREIRAKKVVFTHLSHYFAPHDVASNELPLGFDGMEIDI